MSDRRASTQSSGFLETNQGSVGNHNKDLVYIILVVEEQNRTIRIIIYRSERQRDVVMTYSAIGAFLSTEVLFSRPRSI